MITIGRMFRFEAAHRLSKHKGKCKNLHGHSYRLLVEVQGEINKETNMVMDFAELDKIVKLSIIDWVDHSNLNETLKLEDPTAEVMVDIFARQLVTILPNNNIFLSRVKLWETEKSYATWERKNLSI